MLTKATIQQKVRQNATWMRYYRMPEWGKPLQLHPRTGCSKTNPSRSKWQSAAPRSQYAKQPNNPNACSLPFHLGSLRKFVLKATCCSMFSSRVLGSPHCRLAESQYKIPRGSLGLACSKHSPIYQYLPAPTYAIKNDGQDPVQLCTCKCTQKK